MQHLNPDIFQNLYFCTVKLLYVVHYNVKNKTTDPKKRVNYKFHNTKRSKSSK